MIRLIMSFLDDGKSYSTPGMAEAAPKMGIGERLAVPRRKSMQRSMTLLVPLAGAARTGIVPPGLRMRLRSAFRRPSKRRGIPLLPFWYGGDRGRAPSHKWPARALKAVRRAHCRLERDRARQDYSTTGHVRMIRAERLLPDGQRPLVKWSGAASRPGSDRARRDCSATGRRPDDRGRAPSPYRQRVLESGPRAHRRPGRIDARRDCSATGRRPDDPGRAPSPRWPARARKVVRRAHSAPWASVQLGEIVQLGGDNRVIGTKCLLPNRQRALVKWPGAHVGALGAIQPRRDCSETATSGSSGAEALSLHGQRALRERQARP